MDHGNDVLRRLMCDKHPPNGPRQWSASALCARHLRGASGLGEMSGLALVVLSVVEQRLDAVRAVLAGTDVMAVAASIGVHRSTVHQWAGRHLTEQPVGLTDRSHRPHSSPVQVPAGSRHTLLTDVGVFCVWISLPPWHLDPALSLRADGWLG